MVCNVIYAHLVSTMDHKEREKFDANLYTNQVEAQRASRALRELGGLG